MTWVLLCQHLLAVPSCHHRNCAFLPWDSARVHFSSKPFARLLTVYSSEISGFLIPLTWLQANHYFIVSALNVLFINAISTHAEVSWAPNSFPPFALNFVLKRIEILSRVWNWRFHLLVRLPTAYLLKDIFPIYFAFLLHMNKLLVILNWHLVTALDRPHLNKGRVFQSQVLRVETIAPLLNDFQKRFTSFSSKSRTFWSSLL